MDWIKLREVGREYINKYWYILIVLFAGILLMGLPKATSSEKKTENNIQTTYTDASESLQKSLEEILSKIEGAGRTHVLLTTAAGEQTHYQTDEDNPSPYIHLSTHFSQVPLWFFLSL